MNWEVRIMRSARSFFEPTLYKKDVFRFWPLWAVYTVIWLFLLPLELLSRMEFYEIDRLLQWSLSTPIRYLGNSEIGLLFAFVYGAVCAMAVWHYLYNNRAANLMHSLPLQREGHFLTRTASGITLFVLPHLVIFILTLLAELMAGCGLIGLKSLALWALYQTLLTLFFFALATFCAILTGHILAMPAFFGIANFLVMGIAALVDWLSTFFLYGYQGTLMESGLVLLFTPFLLLSGTLYTETELITVKGYELSEYFLQGTVGIWIYAALAVILLAAALLFFRKRHMESAGDVVAVPFLRPVFCYGVALCGGLAGGGITATLFNSTGTPGLLLCLLLWTAISFFAARMLLEKSFRVFRGSGKGCAAALAVIALMVGVLHFDLLGVETRVPDPDRVASVQISGASSYPSDDMSWLSVYGVTDPEAIARIVAVHQAIVDDLDYIRRLEDNSDYWYDSENFTKGTVVDNSFRVTYTMKSGATITRRYPTLWMEYSRLSDPDSLESLYTQMLNDPAILKEVYKMSDLEKATTAYVHLEYTHSSNYGIMEDMEYYLQLGYTEEEFLAGAVDWEYFPTYEKEELNAAQTAALRTALLADLEAGNLGTRYLFVIDPALETETLEAFLTLEIPFTESYTNSDGEIKDYEYYTHFTVILSTRATATLHALRDLGLLQYPLYTCGGQPFDLP